MKVLLSSLVVLILSGLVQATSPKVVTHKQKTDFEKGTLKNVMIDYDGTLKPAPVITPLFDTGEPFVWKLAKDADGNIYVATGIDGHLYRISTHGDSTLLFDAPQMNIFALAVDKANNVYAATSPNGKIYKIGADGQSREFFDPEAVYIWDLVIDSQGNLIIATGEPAGIVRVTPDGQSSQLYKGEENHVRVLLLHGGTLYAGTSSPGYVYRLVEGEKPLVLFDTEMKEVFALAVKDQFLYAAASGEPSISLALPTAVQQETRTRESDRDSQDSQNSIESSGSVQKSLASLSFRAPTSLFRISKQGYGKNLWVGVDDNIQSILAHPDFGVLVGSSQNGKLLSITERGELSVLLKNDESHITAMLQSAQGRIILGMSNLGRVYVLENKIAEQARFESEPIDAGLPSNWGLLTWDGDSKKEVKFSTRSGNTEQPSATWSEWQPVEPDGEVYRIQSPLARFIQWRCVFADEKATVERVSLSYSQINLAPSISSIIVHPPNHYYKVKEENSDEKKGITFPAPLPNKQEKRGFRTIDWLFEDPNFDALTFDLYYRLKGSVWRELASDLNNAIYAWDSQQMMDGEYEIKVVASDAVSNPEGGLTGEKISRPFIIDNSSPVVEDLKTGNKGGQKMLTFRIVDEWNPIKTVSYSMNGQQWQEIVPLDGIMDYKQEQFRIELPGGRLELAIKAEDAIGNVRVYHTFLN